MKLRHILPLLGILILITSPLSVFAQADQPTNTGQQSPLIPNSPQAITYHLEGDAIDLYPESEQDHFSPAVAYSPSADQYLVVWVYEYSETDYDIYGRFIDQATGVLVGNVFAIAETENMEDAPDVAYDSQNDRFLVVWTEYMCEGTRIPSCAKVIRGALLFGAAQEGNQFASADIDIAAQFGGAILASALDNPAVAYNADDSLFQIVFTRDPYSESDPAIDIFGQMLDAHPSAPTLLGPAEGFIVRDYDSPFEAGAPDIAWSDSSSDTFLVTYAVSNTSSDASSIVVVYIYNTYQGGADQWIGRWTMAPLDFGTHPLTNNCFNPSVAYDPQRQAYVVVFSYLEQNAYPFPASIYGQRLLSEYNLDTFSYDGDYAFPIVRTEGSTEWSFLTPAIQFSGITHEMNVFYLARYVSIVGTSYTLFDLSLNATTVGSGLSVKSVMGTGFPSEPALACAGGACLAVWKDLVLFGGADSNVVAQRIWPDCYTLTRQLNPACPECGISVDTPENCYTGYVPGTEVGLTALDFGNYVFTHWSGDASGTDYDITITMDSDKTVIANFSQLPDTTRFFLPMVIKGE
ncbi:MAG: hypothetical protein JW726_10900 [Anaerolineales bacterium]|nr:hypothetical protein [Anaerolineales bacterium]